MQHPISDLSCGGPTSPAPHASMLQAYYRLLDQYVPPSVLVNHAWEILHVIGSITDHLSLPTGPFSRNLLSLLPEEWRKQFSPIVAEISQGNTLKNRQTKRVKIVQNTTTIWISIHSIGQSNGTPIFHVVFTEEQNAINSPKSTQIPDNGPMNGEEDNPHLSDKNTFSPKTASFSESSQTKDRSLTGTDEALNHPTTSSGHFEQTVDAVIIEDFDGKIQKWNQAASRLFGYSLDEVKGRNSTCILPPGKTAEQNAIQILVKGGMHLPNIETERLRKNGQILDVSLSVTPMMNENGKVVQLLFVIRDVSETKQIAHKLVETANMECQRVMAGGIAHQFNNLLTGVLANASYLQCEHGEDPRIQEPVIEIKEAANKASELCSKMLSYARKVSYSKKHTDFKTIVTEAVLTIQQSIDENICIEFVAEDEAYFMQVDPPYMRQALLSVLYNAVEAIDGKLGLIRVCLERTNVDKLQSQRNALSKTMLQPGPHVAVSISDNGPGIKPEHLHKIFDPFFSTKFMGRGLGLAATCGIIRDHQGDFEVLSRAGKGTTVMLFLPFSPLEED